MYLATKLFVLGSCCVSTALVLADVDADVHRPTVTLASGVVVGTATTFHSATAPVNKFIGIPYAASPPERFSPPRPHASWTKPLDAVETKPACFQQFPFPESPRRKTKAVFNNPGGAPLGQSEDCLYVNVYVPPGTMPSSGKAVMFWIYGGDLQFGSGGDLAYDGTSFAANQDIILVTHNYRTNAFGYPNAPELASNEQNAGFLDQRAALAWVRANIEKFGGDPEKITIFGESAGGASVKQLLAVPPSPLPFRAAIMESEAVTTSGNGTASWEMLVELLGCSKAASQLHCMRSKPAKMIRRAINRQGLNFVPVNNGLTSIADITTAIQAGTSAKVPFIIGSNKDEGRAFTFIMGLDKPGAHIGKFLNSTFPGNVTAQRMLRGAFKASGQTPYIFAAEVITNNTFLCPTSELAALAHRHNYQVHRYLFNATFPNTQAFPDAGVYHSSEIQEVFGTYPRKGATEQQKKLSQFMQTAWATFAKAPAQGPGWPALGAEGNVADLGGGGIDGQTTILASSIDETCGL